MNDLDLAMWNVINGSNSSPAVIQPEVSIAKKREFICKNIWNIRNHKDCVYIAEVLPQNGLLNSIKESSEGCRINLDIIDDNIINQMYSRMLYKLKIV